MVCGEPIMALCQRFVNTCKSERTKRAYFSDLVQFMDFCRIREKHSHCLVRMSRAELYTAVSEFLISHTKRDPKSQHVLNGTTVNRKRFTLVRFFDFLADTYEFPFNPARKMPLHPPREFSNTPILSQEEVRQVLTYLSGRRRQSKAAFRDYLIISTLFHFALRRHELVNLQWSDIYEHPWHRRIRQKGNRLKFLPIFDEYKARLEEFAALYGKSSSYLFTPMKNNKTKDLLKPISTNTVLDIVKKVAREVLDGKHIVPHSFRATFICLARDAGIDDKSILNSTGKNGRRH